MSKQIRYFHLVKLEHELFLRCIVPRLVKCNLMLFKILTLIFELSTKAFLLLGFSFQQNIYNLSFVIKCVISDSYTRDYCFLFVFYISIFVISRFIISAPISPSFSLSFRLLVPKWRIAVSGELSSKYPLTWCFTDNRFRRKSFLNYENPAISEYLKGLNCSLRLDLKLSSCNWKVAKSFFILNGLSCLNLLILQ